MSTEQETIIGIHPASPDFFGVWLSHTDLPASDNKKHRALSEKAGSRTQAIDQVAAWVLDHLISDFMKTQMHEERLKILASHKMEKLSDKFALLPKQDRTVKGVIPEVVLIEYLKKTTGYTPIIHKLHYNPNVDQSMKGDDCLLFDPVHIKHRVIYGESKFRSVPSKQVIQEIVDNLQNNKRLPVSLPFVANILAKNNQADKAREVMEVLNLINEGKTPIHNAGFLFSLKSTRNSVDTYHVVEQNLTTTNPNLVFISLGIDNPSGFISDVMAKVTDMFNNL